MDQADAIRDFLRGQVYAVAGASRDRAKYGNRCLRSLVEAGREVFAVHPTEQEVEGRPAFPDLPSVPTALHGVSIVTPPPVTEQVVEDAAAAGVSRLWMQPGAESPAAVRRARELGLSVVAGGPCLLVALGWRG